MIRNIALFECKKIKVFSPSKGKVVNKLAYIVGKNRLTSMAILKEDVSLYGVEPTQAHTILVDDGLGVFHFCGGAHAAIKKFAELSHEEILNWQTTAQKTYMKGQQNG